MQSDWVDVVLDSSNMAFRDKDNILDQIYKKPIFWDLYYEDLKLLDPVKSDASVHNSTVAYTEVMFYKVPETHDHVLLVTL